MRVVDRTGAVALVLALVVTLAGVRGQVLPAPHAATTVATTTTPAATATTAPVVPAPQESHPALAAAALAAQGWVALPAPIVGARHSGATPAAAVPGGPQAPVWTSRPTSAAIRAHAWTPSARRRSSAPSKPRTRNAPA